MDSSIPPAKINEGRRLLNAGGSRSEVPEPIDDASGTYTLEEGIDAVGVGRFQSLLMLYVGFAWMSDAMEMMLLSFLGPAATCQWDLSPFQKSAITSVVFIGMTFGAYSWGGLSDAKGRRLGFCGTAVFTALWGFASALAPSYGWLLLFRGLVGFGLGGVPVAFGLFLEFIPSSHRGQQSVILQSAWTVGALLEAGLAWAILPTGGWRVLLAVSTIPLVFLLILFPLLPESPHYLVTKGEIEKAEAVLAKMAKINGTSLPPGRLTATKPVHRDELIFVKKGLSSKINDVFQTIRDGMKKIYSPAMRRTTILLQYTWVTNAMTYYGLVLLTTELHAESKNVCKDKKPTIDNKDYRDIFITTMAESVGLVLAYITVDRLGRLRSMAVYLFECTAALLPLLFHRFSAHNATYFLFLARAGIVGSFTVIFTYTTEVYPTAVRSFGLGFANAWSRFGGLMAPLVVVELVDKGADWLAEAVLLGMCLFAGISVLLMPIETAGRELQDDNEIEMTSVTKKTPALDSQSGHETESPTPL